MLDKRKDTQNLNIVFFVVLLLILGGGIKGYKKGMVEELNTAIALVLSLIAIIMFIVAAKGYVEHETLRTILGIVCLTIAVLVYRIADFILSSLKMIFSIPVIRGINKIFGIGVGIVEAILITWIVFIIIVAFQFGGVSSYILSAVEENLFLTYLFQNNYIAKLLADNLPYITVFSEISGLGGK